MFATLDGKSPAGFDYFDDWQEEAGDTVTDKMFPALAELGKFLLEYWFKKWSRRHRKGMARIERCRRLCFKAKVNIADLVSIQLLHKWNRYTHLRRHLRKLDATVVRCGINYHYKQRCYLLFWFVRIQRRKRAKRKIFKFWERFWLLNVVFKKVGVLISVRAGFLKAFRSIVTFQVFRSIVTFQAFRSIVTFQGFRSIVTFQGFQSIVCLQVFRSIVTFQVFRSIVCLQVFRSIVTFQVFQIIVCFQIFRSIVCFQVFRSIVCFQVFRSIVCLQVFRSIVTFQVFRSIVCLQVFRSIVTFQVFQIMVCFQVFRSIVAFQAFQSIVTFQVFQSIVTFRILIAKCRSER